MTFDWRQAVLLDGLSATLDRFNSAASELQKTEFNRPRTPNEWQRMAKTRHARNHGKLLAAVVPLIEAFAAAKSDDRSRVTPMLNPDALWILRMFAHDAPLLAVRRESPVLITQGLTALAIIGETDDVRDLTFYLAMLHHSALKLGIDTRQIFGDVATMTASTPLRDSMRSFPLRSPKDRDLSAFYLRETLADGEFDLVQDSQSGST
jgi:hypothetical protein